MEDATKSKGAIWLNWSDFLFQKLRSYAEALNLREAMAPYFCHTCGELHHTKPEHNMLKLLPIIPLALPKKLPVFLFILISFIIYYSYFVLCAFCFRCWHPEKHGLDHDECFAVAIVYMSVMHKHTVQVKWVYIWSMKVILAFP